MRDLQAFEQYVLARWTTFHRLAILLTASESVSQDLLQVTLEKAYVAWPKISTMAHPDAYVRTIMVNALVSTHRLARNRHEFASAEPPERGLPPREDEVLDHFTETEVKEAIEALPEQFRMAVLLGDVEGFSYKEIAEILDVPIGTVMSRLHRGRRALQKRLYEFGRQRGLVPEREGTHG